MEVFVGSNISRSTSFQALKKSSMCERNTRLDQLKPLKLSEKDMIEI